MEVKLFDNLLNEAETTKYMACCYDPEDYYEETNYIDEDGELNMIMNCALKITSIISKNIFLMLMKKTIKS